MLLFVLKLLVLMTMFVSDVLKCFACFAAGLSGVNFHCWDFRVALRVQIVGADHYVCV